MPRKAQCDGLVGMAADGNPFFCDLHPFPAVAIPIKVGIVGMRVIAEYILLIVAIDGQRKGRRAVMPHRNAGHGRFTRADGVKARHGKMHHVTDGGQHMRPMRIQAQDGSPGRRARA